jgi:UDP-galactopyranose mutase
VASLLESCQGLDPSDYHLVVVGSGFYGLTVAQMAASAGFRVLVIERRDHLGGNAWSYLYQDTGIEVHRYGSHLFHTSSERVWAYINQFDTFTSYQHRVWSISRGRAIPLPFTLATVNTFYGLTLTPAEAREFVASRCEGNPDEARSLEEYAISTVGRDLYEELIAGYTTKQWQLDPALLPRETIARLPIRYTYDTNYFTDKYQGLPTRGYGRLLEEMVASPLIRVALRTDYFDIRSDIPSTKPVVFTGPLDRYFDYSKGALSWRTLDFDWEVRDVSDFQGAAVLNYADKEIPYTRVHEYKHLHPERDVSPDRTVVAFEYSRLAGPGDEPYYPVNSVEDRARLVRYREMAKELTNVHFGGRLGTYKYLDMHMAIASALTAFDDRIRPLLEVEAARQ